jgi:hypothetical protein
VYLTAMGLTLSTDFTVEYGVYREHLDNIDKDGVEKTYEKIMRKGFSDLYDVEAVCRLICYNATIQDSSLVYAQLAKKLENEIEGGINRFSVVFQRIVTNMVSNSIGESGKLQDEKRQKTAKLITEFLANLFKLDVVDKKVIGDLVRQAKIKNQLDKYVKQLTSLTKKELNALGYTDFDEIQVNSSDNETVEIG